MPACYWCQKALSLDEWNAHSCAPMRANDARLAAAAAPAGAAPARLSAFTVYAQHELRDEHGALVAVVEPRGEGVALRLAACWNGTPTAWLQNWNSKDEVLELFGPHESIEATLRYWMERSAKNSQRAADAAAQRDQLLEAVEEWFCPACRRVYPPGSVKGCNTACSCGAGLLRPTSFNQRRAEQERDAACAQRDHFEQLAKDNGAVIIRTACDLGAMTAERDALLGLLRELHAAVSACRYEDPSHDRVHNALKDAGKLLADALAKHQPPAGQPPA